MEWDEFPGRLEAKETVEIRPRVGGYVQTVSFKEGGIVNAGDLLFVIDPRPFQAELARTQGEVGRAKARLALAETEFKRTQRLVPTEAASQLELDEKQAGLDETKAQLEVAEANVESARLNVEFTHIRAPIMGRISRIYVTLGNLVTGGAQGGESTLLTTITSIDPIYCYVDADERSVLKYRRLAQEKTRISARDALIPCKLALLNEDEFDHLGTVDFVDNRVDPSTATLRARGVFPNPSGEMTPGLFGRVRVPGAAPYRALLVAELAIQSDQSQKYVLTVDDAGVVHKTYVTLGSAFGGLRAITSGLTAYDRVIVNGILRARPEGKVNAVNGPMPSEKDAETFAAPALTTQPTTQPTTTSSTAAPSTQPVGARTLIAPMVGVAQEVGR